ncbi:hypothetical protein D770_10455 [Flammeovirgaceae bacterium 311]|nr:hypothetical protein D770_10455 [Flammeovirgaceae bacterium 311]
MSVAVEPLEVLFKIAQRSKEYYQLLADGPQQEHFDEFLESLPEGLRSYYQQKGFKGSQKNILFRRYVLEQAGRRMDAYLRERLDTAEFRLWQEQDAYQMKLFFSLKQSA